MNYCSDPAMLPLLSAIRKIILIIQIVAPIVLIIWATVGIGSMVLDPEQKGGMKKIINKFIAAAFIFIIPFIINIFVSLAANASDPNSNFGKITNCWAEARDFSFSKTVYEDSN